MVQACEKAKVPCDFYVKTFHSLDYPSAKMNCDSSWCSNPQETAEFMRTVKKPWIAYKVLAAGAIAPRQGFAYAFRNGADFIAVGMFDFQVKENCELMPRIIKMTQKRARPWYSLRGVKTAWLREVARPRQRNRERLPGDRYPYFFFEGGS